MSKDAIDAKARLLNIISCLRAAIALAKKRGEPKIGILSVGVDSTRTVAVFDGSEFIEDLCRILGVPLTNSEEEQRDADSHRLSQIGPEGRE